MKIHWYELLLIPFSIVLIVSIYLTAIQKNDKVVCIEKAQEEFEFRAEVSCKKPYPCFIEDEVELHILDVFKDEVYECTK